MSADWTLSFDELNGLGASVRERLIARSSVVPVPAGTIIFGPGKIPSNLLLLLEGTVRVQQFSENGREIVLYRVQAGQSCVLTTSCLLADEAYTAEGIAETDVTAVAIPRAEFDDLISNSEVFRHFVFAAYSKRITDLFFVIEELAFRRVDIRLAQKLLDLENQANIVKSTHQQLAAELGTAREVISRQLQEFQRRGWISQTRGSIELTDIPNLKRQAATA